MAEGCACTGSALTVKAQDDMFVGGSAARKITEDIYWVGGSDKRLALFENHYPLERGVSYNSYVVVDDKVALIDTADKAVAGQFFENVDAVLNGRAIDYVVVNHMEPDHSYALGQVLARYPQAKVLCSPLAAKFIGQFFSAAEKARCITVLEGDTVELGKHELSFIEAPWVHWPEVMMTYDAVSGTLFSADAFGTFGALDGNIYADQVNFADEWLDDARRYYCNIVGKYGPYVQDVLKKAADLQLQRVCPAHGPIWRTDLGWYINKYNAWSTYEPEDNAVAIFCGSIYGGTENAANILASKLSAAGVRDVKVYDVSKTDVSYLVAEAFRCSHLVFASVTYNDGIFTKMRDLLEDLADHHMRNRHVSFVQNGTWHPHSGELMRELVADKMPGMTMVGDVVTVKSAVNDCAIQQIDALAGAIAASLKGDDSQATQLSEAAVDTVSGATAHAPHAPATPEPEPAPSKAVQADGSIDPSQLSEADKIKLVMGLPLGSLGGDGTPEKAAAKYVAPVEEKREAAKVDAISAATSWFPTMHH